MSDLPEFEVTLERDWFGLWIYTVVRTRPYQFIRTGSAFGKERARRKAAKATAHPERFVSKVTL